MKDHFAVPMDDADRSDTVVARSIESLERDVIESAMQRWAYYSSLNGKWNVPEAIYIADKHEAACMALAERRAKP